MIDANTVLYKSGGYTQGSVLPSHILIPVAMQQHSNILLIKML
jgi:hypothetical protein